MIWEILKAFSSFWYFSISTKLSGGDSFCAVVVGICMAISGVIGVIKGLDGQND